MYDNWEFIDVNENVVYKAVVSAFSAYLKKTVNEILMCSYWS